MKGIDIQGGVYRGKENHHVGDFPGKRESSSQIRVNKEKRRHRKGVCKKNPFMFGCA